MTYDSLPQLGIPVHHVDLRTVLEAIDGFIRVGRRTGRSHQIVTVNTDFLVQARRHPDVHAILRSAALAIPDGMPIVWASAALGQRLPARIAGADLATVIAERAAQRGYRLMFFGGADGVADRAAQLLRDSYPGLEVATIAGDVGANGATDPALLDEIRGYRPDVILVALGHPKQERWIRRHASNLGIPVAIGVGGTFDFIAGERRRATPWVQRSGFEWLYRLAQEPGRLSQRYLTDFAVFIPSIMAQIVTTRLRRPSPRREAVNGHRRHGHPTGGLEVQFSGHDVVVVALSRPGRIDHRTAAELTSLATRNRRQGREVRLVAPDAKAMRSLRRLQLDRLVALIPSADARVTRMSPPPRSTVPASSTAATPVARPGRRVPTTTPD